MNTLIPICDLINVQIMVAKNRSDLTLPHLGKLKLEENFAWGEAKDGMRRAEGLWERPWEDGITLQLSYEVDTAGLIFPLGKKTKK